MFQKSVPISNRLYSKSLSKAGLKLKIPTSPESDGEIYLTPNTSVTANDDKTDSGMEEMSPIVFARLRERNPLQPTVNGYRVNKIQSMNNIPEKHVHTSSGEDQVDSGMDENNFSTPENGFKGIHRMKSLGSLSQYEMSFGATPKSLTKLKDDLELRQQALVKRRSMTNLYESSLKEAEIEERETFKRESIFGRSAQGQSKYKRKYGVGDTKYIGIDDTPDKSYQLTKMKSLGTIPDLLSERISYDPFLTPMVGRRHPASVHDFDGDRRSSPRQFDDSNGSSDLEDEVDFLRHQPDEHVRFMNESHLMKGSFERGFRRSYNRKHDQTKPTTPLRQSDGYFQMPAPVGNGKSYRQQGPEQRSRSSVHSLPSDGKFEVIIRYDLAYH